MHARGQRDFLHLVFCLTLCDRAESRIMSIIKALSESSGSRETHVPVFRDRCAVYMRFVRGKPPLEYLYTRVLLVGGHPQYLGWSYPQSRGQARLKTDTGRSCRMASITVPRKAATLSASREWIAPALASPDLVLETATTGATAQPYSCRARDMLCGWCRH